MTVIPSNAAMELQDKKTLIKALNMQTKIIVITILVVALSTIFFSPRHQSSDKYVNDMLKIQKNINKTNLEHRMALESLNVLIRKNSVALYQQDSLLTQNIIKNKKLEQLKLKTNEKEYKEIDGYITSDILREYSRLDSIIRQHSTLSE